MSDKQKQEHPDKPRNTKETAIRLLKIIAEQKWRIGLIIFAAISYSILTVLAPMISSQIIDGLFAMTNSNNNVTGLHAVLTHVGKSILLILIIYLLTSMFSYMQEFLVSSVSERTTLSIKKKISHKLNNTELKYFDTHQTGDVLSRVTNDMERISEALQMSVVQLITSIFTVIGSVIMMARMNVILTIISLTTTALSILVTKIVAEKSLMYAADRQSKQGILNSHVEEKYSGRTIIKAFNRDAMSLEEFKKANKDLYTSNLRAEFVMHAINPVIRFINRIGYVLVALVSGYLYTQGLVTIGNIQAFIQYINQITEPLTQASFGINSLQSALASAERVFEVLDAKDEVSDKNTVMDAKNIKGQIRFEHVAFGYTDQNLMKDISISIKPGEMVAIVGPTGAGKTTLVNLLMRFYEVRSGRISIDGIDITDFNRRMLRKKFGMVLQDTWLFDGSIAENISYGRPEASLSEIINVAKSSHIDHFIRTLPEGYDSLLNNDTASLSSGQKQLLTIARAMLTDPAILILDEATSSVDTRTEMAIQDAMNTLMKGRTSLVIAHRLSTIRNADLILVMNNGTIIEQGSHEELIKKNGFYESLYNSQFSSSID